MNGVSRTAGNMAAVRALETLKPEAERLFADPYAIRFLRPGEQMLASAAHVPAIRHLLEAYFDDRAPGARTSGAARTRLIDDWICAECEEGAEQVVFLGAGFDTRAMRLPALAKVRVFELDRAPMLTLKARRLGQSPANLVRAPIDFMRDSIEATLMGAGFDASKRTVFVWEGVTNYLDQHAVDAVFQIVGLLKARIIFTYVHADAISGRFDAPGIEALLKRLRKVGEPWTFGFKPEDVPAYLRGNGLKRCVDLGAAEYRAIYRTGDASRPEGYEFYRVALAEPL
jgi:methyltransferase (TIGR00027 family)